MRLEFYLIIKNKQNRCISRHQFFGQKCSSLRFYQFLAEMSKAKISYLFWLCRLVSMIDNVMHLACLVKQTSADLISWPMCVHATHTVLQLNKLLTPQFLKGSKLQRNKELETRLISEAVSKMAEVTHDLLNRNSGSD